MGGVGGEVTPGLKPADYGAAFSRGLEGPAPPSELGGFHGRKGFSKERVHQERVSSEIGAVVHAQMMQVWAAMTPGLKPADYGAAFSRGLEGPAPPTRSRGLPLKRNQELLG